MVLTCSALSVCSCYRRRKDALRSFIRIMEAVRVSPFFIAYRKKRRRFQRIRARANSYVNLFWACPEVERLLLPVGRNTAHTSWLRVQSMLATNTKNGFTSQPILSSPIGKSRVAGPLSDGPNLSLCYSGVCYGYPHFVTLTYSYTLDLFLFVIYYETSEATRCVVVVVFFSCKWL